MEIEREELLRYLGYKGQEINKELDEKISQAISICKSTINPKHVLKKYKLNWEEKSLEGTTLIIKGESLWKHLSGCTYVYLIGATLGFEMEKRIARAFNEDRTLAVLLDSAATCAIESYLDEVEKTLDGKLVSRYSCGYGDWPIEQQKEICQVLDTARKIGLFVNSAYMLTPQKSVTAIIGIKDEY